MGARAFPSTRRSSCDPDGSPTGALLENGAMDLVRDVVPAWTEAEALDAYAATLRALNRVGLTGAHVMVGDPELLDTCRALEARGDLCVRLLVPMHQAPSIDDAEVERRLPLAREHGRLWRAGTAKFFLDGVLDSGTAWLVEPGPGGANAHPFWPDVARYAELVARFTRAGFSAITHAVGDGAVRGALDAYAAAGPPQRGMHRVEHIETLLDADLPRFAAQAVAASMQPLHMEGLDDPATPSSWVDGLSAGRYERGFRAGDLARAGAVLPLGSDWFVADFDPRVGLAWAQLRRAPGRPGPHPVPPRPGARRGDRPARLHHRGGARGRGRGRLRAPAPRPARRRHRARRGPARRGAGRPARRPGRPDRGRRRRRVRRLTLGFRLQPHLTARARVVNPETETTRTPRRIGATVARKE